MIVTVEIPCGRPDTFFDSSTNSHRDWAYGNQGDASYYADLIDANTAPHDTSTMSAPGDGSWLTLDQASFHADMEARFGPAGGGAYFLSSIGRMDYPASIPANITSLSLIPIFRARTSAVTPTRNFRATAYTGNGFETFSFTSPDLASTDWYHNDDAGFLGVFHTGIEATRVALNAGAGHVAVEPFNWGRNGDAPDPAPTWVDDIDYAAIRIQWEAPGGPRPLRQYPRTDGLATSSARRMWPPSRSYQRSNRRAGGYL